MKISEVRIQYNQQIKSYREQQVLLANRKKELEQKIRNAIRDKYYDPREHTFDGGVWTTNAMALMARRVPTAALSRR